MILLSITSILAQLLSRYQWMPKLCCVTDKTSYDDSLQILNINEHHCPCLMGFPWYRKLTYSENVSHIHFNGSLKYATSSIITSIRCHLFYQRIMDSCVLSSQALRPPGMMSTKPIEAVRRAVPSHAGGTPVTRYQSLEINYRTAPNNEHTALLILKKNN